ncbi:hypothetical protein ABT086_13915 [Streptomyces mirabilis]
MLHALPKKSSRELRGLVSALDDKILTRGKAIQVDNLDVPWWRDQL